MSATFPGEVSTHFDAAKLSCLAGLPRLGDESRSYAKPFGYALRVADEFVDEYTDSVSLVDVHAFAGSYTHPDSDNASHAVNPDAAADELSDIEPLV